MLDVGSNDPLPVVHALGDAAVVASRREQHIGAIRKAHQRSHSLAEHRSDHSVQLAEVEPEFSVFIAGHHAIKFIIDQMIQSDHLEADARQGVVGFRQPVQVFHRFIAAHRSVEKAGLLQRASGGVIVRADGQTIRRRFR